MPTLLQISDDLQALANLLEEATAESGGEITPEVDAALDGFFAELESARDAKLDSYCALVRQAQLRAAVRREESERLNKLVKADESLSSRLKLRLQLFLSLNGVTKIQTDRYRIAVCANGGRLPLAVEVPPEELPAELQRIDIRPDIDKIRAAIDAGIEVRGCRLLSRCSHLRIN